MFTCFYNLSIFLINPFQYGNFSFAFALQYALIVILSVSNGFNALSGSRLMVLKGLDPGGDVRTLSPTKTQADGAFLRPDISFDGKKVLFSYRAEDEMNYHIYEMNVDGSGLKQLTFGNYDDNDPIYLPDGKIMFVTTRGNTYIRCTHYSRRFSLSASDFM